MAVWSVGLVASVASAQDPIDVPTSRPERREVVEYDEYTGRFEAIRRVEVRARVQGFLEQVAFQEGQLVEEGALLYVLDQRPFQIALDAARAELAEAIARRDLARLEVARSRKLLERRTIPQDQYDEVFAAQQGATAQVANREAAVARAALELEWTQVRAPIAGRVGERLVDEGNLISGGDSSGTLLTTIVQEDPIYFVFEVSEAAFLKYTRLSESGRRPTSRTTPNAVAIKLLDEEDFVHHGVMDFVDNELDASSGTLEGRAVLANPGSFLQPGVFGRLRLQGSGLYEAILIPDHTIQFDQSRRFVFVVDAQSRVDRRFVTPGPLIGEKRIVREGLDGSEQLIEGAYHRIRVGDVVRVAPSKRAE